MTEIFNEVQERLLEQFDNGQLRVKFIVPVLVGAIRELESRLDTLKAECEANRK